jgi:hypothetical protein
MWSVERDWYIVEDSLRQPTFLSRGLRANRQLRDVLSGELRTRDGAMDEEARELRSSGEREV